MSRRMILERMKVLGLCGALLASGCEMIAEKLTQKAAEAAIEHAVEKKTGGEVKLDTSGGTLSLKSDKGSMEFAAGGAKVPESWPGDVPPYPGAKVTMAMAGPNHHMLSLETADSPEKAVEFYKGKLASMTQEAVMNTEQQSMLYYKDATGRRVQLAIGKESGGAGPNTTIALIINTEKQKAAGAN